MRHHRSLTLLGVTAAATIGAMLAVPTSAESSSVAAQARPVLAIHAATSRVTLPRSDGSVRLGNLGAYLVAGDEPFEVAVTRQSYSDPVIGHWLRSDGSTVEFSQDMISSFRKARGFFHIRVRNLDGKLMADQEEGLCPSGWDVSRARPDAPDRSPYPQGCGGYMPWTLGSFWGLQAGWGVSVPGGRAELPVGRYVATVRIDDDYRKLLGIPADAASAQIKVRVVKNGNACLQHRGCRLGDPLSADRGRQHTLRAAANQPAGNDRPLAGDPLPDLRSLPAWNIGVHHGNVLHFNANVWNAGPSTLVVDGFRRQHKNVMDAYQYFYDENGQPTGSAKVGTMEWHAAPSHHHWHFLDFARYRLLDADKQAVVRSRKASFCLAATDAVDYTVPGANWHPWNTDLSTACGGFTALSVREVLDVGSGDTYSQWRAGQAFSLKGLPNGKYFIEIAANPTGNLYEPDESNNVSYRKVFIGGKPDHRTVRVAPVGMIDVP
jgi:Lysyl oxidase